MIMQDENERALELEREGGGEKIAPSRWRRTITGGSPSRSPATSRL